jgi:hypothetical protein
VSVASTGRRDGHERVGSAVLRLVGVSGKQAAKQNKTFGKTKSPILGSPCVFENEGKSFSYFVSLEFFVSCPSVQKTVGFSS